MIKKLNTWIAALAIIFGMGWLLMTNICAAENSKQIVSVFTAKNCGHCQDLASFLDDQQSANASVTVKYYHLEDKTNADLFEQFTDKYNLAKVTPLILVGGKVIEGFGAADTTGKQIMDLAKTAKNDNFESFLALNNSIVDNNNNSACQINERCDTGSGMVYDIPFFGKKDLSDYPVAVISLILGFIDGFNPCAMWVLIVFITMIAQAKSRKKMWDLVIVFLLAEAIMYNLILNLWYSTWNFVQLDKYVTPIIGIVSIGAAAFFLWEYFTTKAGECKIIDQDSKQKTTARIAALVNSPLSIATFFGTIALAFSINVIEFACSIGIPQAFTKILELNQYSFLFRQFYMLLYTIMYMADDIVVFLVAVYAISYLSLTTKYSKYCQLIGGIIMLLIGIIMIYDPNLLKF
ncbi:MAG TPA: glutaredoxin [bacterium]|nr:glutaredoxin [bacterium]HPN67416.1 glutaredoxin [bacterium]